MGETDSARISGMAGTDWYENPSLLKAAEEEYGSLQAAAYAIGGVSPSTLQKAAHRHGIARGKPGPRPKPPENQEALERLYAKVYGHKA